VSEHIVSITGELEQAVVAAASKGEIVRCRDCYFADEIEGGFWCDRFDCGREHVTPDGYCAWAERRVDR